MLKEHGEDEAWYENAPVSVYFARWEQGADRVEDSPIEHLSADATDVVLDSAYVYIEAETTDGPDGMSRMVRLSKRGPGESETRRYMHMEAEVRWDDVRDAGMSLRDAVLAFEEAGRHGEALRLQRSIEADGMEPEKGSLDGWRMAVRKPDYDWKKINPLLPKLMEMARYGLAEVRVG